MRRFGNPVSNMRVAVGKLDAAVAARAPATAELAAWTARQRARRGSSPPPPLVSSVAPLTALEAWRHEQTRRFIRA